MEDQLQHDPRTKLMIKDALYQFLYASVKEKLDKQLATIIERNMAITGYPHGSFTYKSIWYTNDQTRPPRKLNKLVPQLHGDMDAYLEEIDQLNEKELPYVLGFINQVLNSSNDLHDYLRILPDSVHRPIQRMIDSCPCRTKKLSEEEINTLQTINKHSIDLIKRRMVTNLII